MEDLLQSQIQESCRLAMPNGLKELMSDISREVLRAQPPDMLKFITDYLSTLLVTRENLHVAARVCDTICDCDCREDLEDELVYIGMDKNSASNAAEIVEKVLGIGEVNEGKLLLKLANRISIDEGQVPAILSAIRRAYIRHQKNHTQIYETSSTNSDENDITRATRHTLLLYRKTEPTPETFNRMANKIQFSYRAYQVRRETGTKRTTKTDQLSRTPSKSESFSSSDQAVTKSTDNTNITPIRTDVLEKRKVAFGDFNQESVASEQALVPDADAETEQHKIETDHSQKPRSSLNRLSSTSLAGSYLSLPRFKPYSAHDIETLAGLEEIPEKERFNYDYIDRKLPIDMRICDDMTIEIQEQTDRIMSFYDLPDGNTYDEEGNVEFEEIAEVIEGEDVIEEDIIIEEDLVEEDMIEDYIVENDNIIKTDEDTTEVYETEYVAEETQDEVRKINIEEVQETDILAEGSLEGDVQKEIDVVENDIKQNKTESGVLDEYKEELDIVYENMTEDNIGSDQDIVENSNMISDYELEDEGGFFENDVTY